VLPRLALLLFIAALSSGCLSVYLPELQQGNAVTQEMVEKLKLGMTRNQVRFVLGTPLVADTFHPDRWDYYFYLKKTGETRGEQRLLTVYFENDVLARVEGDVVPPTPQPTGTPATGTGGPTPPPSAPSPATP
jgi:outer membrane protein assembly factor BamE